MYLKTQESSNVQTQHPSEESFKCCYAYTKNAFIAPRMQQTSRRTCRLFLPAPADSLQCSSNIRLKLRYQTTKTGATSVKKKPQDRQLNNMQYFLEYALPQSLGPKSFTDTHSFTYQKYKSLKVQTNSIKSFVREQPKIQLILTIKWYQPEPIS